MKKEVVIEKLIAMQENMVTELQNRVSITHSMVDIDEEDVKDPEDYSHQYESGEMEQLIKVQLNRAETNLDRLKNMDFSAKNSVKPGALVITNNNCFVVGFSATPFKVDDCYVIGISVESPIYAVMVDKITGQSFTHCGVNYTIEQIL